MLDLRTVVANLDATRAQLARRGGTISLDDVARIAADRSACIAEVEGLQRQRNEANERIKKTPGPPPAELRDELRALGERIREGETRLREIEASLEERLLVIPNVPDSTVPDGKGAEDNPVVRTWGSPPAFSFAPRPHWEVGERLGLLDFERAAKISGARFVVLRGNAARLERALISFMLDVARTRGYFEVMPPFLVRRESMIGTGQLPKFGEEAF